MCNLLTGRFRCCASPGFLISQAYNRLRIQSTLRTEGLTELNIAACGVRSDPGRTTLCTLWVTVLGVGRWARHAVPLRGRDRCCSKLTMNARSQERPSWTGRAGSGLLHRAVLPKSVSLRRMPDRATLGERVSSRISANAVGRRGHFPEGRCSPDFCNEAPPGNAPSGGAKRPRRPGLESRFRISEQVQFQRQFGRVRQQRPGQVAASATATATASANCDRDGDRATASEKRDLQQYRLIACGSAKEVDTHLASQAPQPPSLPAYFTQSHALPTLKLRRATGIQ